MTDRRRTRGAGPPRGKIDKDAVRAAAVGRWAEILEVLAGVPPELLDGRGHPCPWCGGTDRFAALPDFASTGAVLCRHCHDRRNGDGFAAVMQANGWTFTEAVAAVAEHLGLTAHGPAARRTRTVTRRVGGRRTKRRTPDRPPAFWEREAKDLADALTADVLDREAARLGLPADALARLGVGWCPDQTALTVPMRDADGTIIGIRTRTPGGDKRAITGSRNGLFLPAEWTDAPPERPDRLVLAEGPTDAAALLAWGFTAAGRPNDAGGMLQAEKLVDRLNPAEVVVLADADGPGRKGAAVLSNALKRSVPVRLAEPPVGVKDARDWFGRGATAAEVSAVIDAAPILRLTVGREGGAR